MLLLLLLLFSHGVIFTRARSTIHEGKWGLLVVIIKHSRGI